MNSLYQIFGQNALNNQMSQMMGEISKFARAIKGDPQQMVMQLLNSGQMSQNDFNKYAQMAGQIAPLFGGK